MSLRLHCASDEGFGSFFPPFNLLQFMKCQNKIRYFCDLMKIMRGDGKCLNDMSH